MPENGFKWSSDTSGTEHATAAHLTTDLKDYSHLLPPMAGHACVAVPVDLHL